MHSFQLNILSKQDTVCFVAEIKNTFTENSALILLLKIIRLQPYHCFQDLSSVLAIKTLGEHSGRSSHLQRPVRLGSGDRCLELPTAASATPNGWSYRRWQRRRGQAERSRRCLREIRGRHAS